MGTENGGAPNKGTGEKLPWLQLLYITDCKNMCLYLHLPNLINLAEAFIQSDIHLYVYKTDVDVTFVLISEVYQLFDSKIFFCNKKIKKKDVYLLVCGCVPGLGPAGGATNGNGAKPNGDHGYGPANGANGQAAKPNGRSITNTLCQGHNVAG